MADADRSLGAQILDAMQADIDSGAFVPDYSGIEPGEHMTRCPCGECQVRAHVQGEYEDDGGCLICDECDLPRDHLTECDCDCKRFAVVTPSRNEKQSHAPSMGTTAQPSSEGSSRG